MSSRKRKRSEQTEIEFDSRVYSGISELSRVCQRIFLVSDPFTEKSGKKAKKTGKFSFSKILDLSKYKKPSKDEYTNFKKSFSKVLNSSIKSMEKKKEKEVTQVFVLFDFDTLELFKKVFSGYKTYKLKSDEITNLIRMLSACISHLSTQLCDCIGDLEEPSIISIEKGLLVYISCLLSFTSIHLEKKRKSEKQSLKHAQTVFKILEKVRRSMLQYITEGKRSLEKYICVLEMSMQIFLYSCLWFKGSNRNEIIGFLVDFLLFPCKYKENTFCFEKKNFIKCVSIVLNLHQSIQKDEGRKKKKEISETFENLYVLFVNELNELQNKSIPDDERNVLSDPEKTVFIVFDVFFSKILAFPVKEINPKNELLMSLLTTLEVFSSEKNTSIFLIPYLELNSKKICSIKTQQNFKGKMKRTYMKITMNCLSQNTGRFDVGGCLERFIEGFLYDRDSNVRKLALDLITTHGALNGWGSDKKSAKTYIKVLEKVLGLMNDPIEGVKTKAVTKYMELVLQYGRLNNENLGKCDNSVLEEIKETMEKIRVTCENYHNFLGGRMEKELEEYQDFVIEKIIEFYNKNKRGRKIRREILNFNGFLEFCKKVAKNDSINMDEFFYSIEEEENVSTEEDMSEREEMEKDVILIIIKSREKSLEEYFFSLVNRKDIITLHQKFTRNLYFFIKHYCRNYVFQNRLNNSKNKKKKNDERIGNAKSNLSLMREVMVLINSIYLGKEKKKEKLKGFEIYESCEFSILKKMLDCLDFNHLLSFLEVGEENGKDDYNCPVFKEFLKQKFLNFIGDGNNKHNNENKNIKIDESSIRKFKCLFNDKKKNDIYFKQLKKICGRVISFLSEFWKRGDADMNRIKEGFDVLFYLSCIESLQSVIRMEITGKNGNGGLVYSIIRKCVSVEENKTIEERLRVGLVKIILKILGELYKKEKLESVGKVFLKEEVVMFVRDNVNLQFDYVKFLCENFDFLQVLVVFNGICEELYEDEIAGGDEVVEVDEDGFEVIKSNEEEERKEEFFQKNILLLSKVLVFFGNFVGNTRDRIKKVVSQNVTKKKKREEGDPKGDESDKNKAVEYDDDLTSFENENTVYEEYFTALCETGYFSKYYRLIKIIIMKALEEDSNFSQNNYMNDWIGLKNTAIVSMGRIMLESAEIAKKNMQNIVDLISKVDSNENGVIVLLRLFKKYQNMMSSFPLKYCGKEFPGALEVFLKICFDFSKKNEKIRYLCVSSFCEWIKKKLVKDEYLVELVYLILDKNKMIEKVIENCLKYWIDDNIENGVFAKGVIRMFVRWNGKKKKSVVGVRIFKKLSELMNIEQKIFLESEVIRSFMEGRLEVTKLFKVIMNAPMGSGGKNIFENLKKDVEKWVMDDGWNRLIKRFKVDKLTVHEFRKYLKKRKYDVKIIKKIISGEI